MGRVRLSERPNIFTDMTTPNQSAMRTRFFCRIGTGETIPLIIGALCCDAFVVHGKLDALGVAQPS